MRGLAGGTRYFLASHAIPSQHHPTCEAKEHVALAGQAGATLLGGPDIRRRHGHPPLRTGIRGARGIITGSGGQEPPYASPYR